MNFLRDLPVLILGLGDSGLAMARWCAGCGARVTVWDSRAQPPGAEALRAEWPAVALLGGELPLQALDGVMLVLKSPGLAPGDARVAPLLQEARAIGIAVLGELDLFARALADLKDSRGYAPQVLAITGTNGKTTTTAMTALLVERAGKRVAMAGNIGPTLLDTLGGLLQAEGPAEAVEPAAPAALETPEPSDASIEADEADEPKQAEQAEQTELTDQPDEAGEAPALAVVPPPPPAPVFKVLPEVWVLELSSFQLEGGGTGVRGFEPSAAVVLNLTQDHLDWHGTMAAYTAAKARIYGSRAVMVVNRDDPRVEALVPVPVPPAGKGKPKAADRPLPRTVLRFGLDAPRHPGDFGLVEENGMAWLVRALPVDDTFKRKKGEEVEIHLQRLMPADALRVRGRHNAANALAALALATAIGCTLAPLLHALRDYEGEPHRVEFVAAVDGVEAFDDSKGTNVGATVAALLGLGADKAPGRLVVILGGDGKGQDFSPLTAPLQRHARAVATLGRDAAAIEAVIEAVPVQRFDTLEQAVAWCYTQARPGDAVLMSPACASLDMFRNYVHRAEVFVSAVQRHAADRGQA